MIGVYDSYSPEPCFSSRVANRLDCPRLVDPIWRWPKAILGRWGWRRWVPTLGTFVIYRTCWHCTSSKFIFNMWSSTIFWLPKRNKIMVWYHIPAKPRPHMVTYEFLTYIDLFIYIYIHSSKIAMRQKINIPYHTLHPHMGVIFLQCSYTPSFPTHISPPAPPLCSRLAGGPWSLWACKAAPGSNGPAGFGDGFPGRWARLIRFWLRGYPINILRGGPQHLHPQAIEL